RAGRDVERLDEEGLDQQRQDDGGRDEKDGLLPHRHRFGDGRGLALAGAVDPWTVPGRRTGRPRLRIGAAPLVIHRVSLSQPPEDAVRNRTTSGAETGAL